MKCGYCLQTNEKSPADHKADPVEFAHKLADYLKGDRIPNSREIARDYF